MTDIPLHHLVYGTLADYVTGEEVVDTDDERVRQSLAHLLIDEKGYQRGDLAIKKRIETLFAGQFVISLIDFVLSVGGRSFMVIRFGPGSIVTRERPAIAAARVLLPDYQIPLALITNGREATMLDALSGKAVGCGFAAIPDRLSAPAVAASLQFQPLAANRREKELRILNAYDVETCCAGGPCPLPSAPEG